MKKIYIAGKYSAPNVIECLNNIRDGIEAATKVIKLGFAPFCPWLDHQFQFFDKTLTVIDYQKVSMEWLKVSDEVWILPGSETSLGTLAEIKEAKRLGIPVRSFEVAIKKRRQK